MEAHATPFVGDNTPTPTHFTDDAFLRPFLVEVDIRPSLIHGSGVFLKSAASRGTVLCNVFRSPDVHFATGAEIYAMWERNPDWMTLITGRISGDYFAYGTYQDAECFLNHDQNANALNYLGQTIALRDIAAGEEVTIDYRLLFAEGMSILTEHGVVMGYANAKADAVASTLLKGLLHAKNTP